VIAKLALDFSVQLPEAPTEHVQVLAMESDLDLESTRGRTPTTASAVG